MKGSFSLNLCTVAFIFNVTAKAQKNWINLCIVMFCKTEIVLIMKLNVNYFISYWSFFCSMNMYKVDRISIQDLVETPFSRKRVAEKNKMIKDGQPYTPLPNAKGRGKKNGRWEFYFKWSNLYDKFRFMSLVDNERLVHDHIF